MAQNNPVNNLTFNRAMGCLTLYWTDPATGSAARKGDVLPPVTIADGHNLKAHLNDPQLKDWVVAEKGDRIVFLPPVKRLSSTTLLYDGVLFDKQAKAKDNLRFKVQPNFKHINLARNRTDLPAVQEVLEFFEENEDLYTSSLQVDDTLLRTGSGKELVVTAVAGNRVSGGGAHGTFHMSTRELLEMARCPRLDAEQAAISVFAAKHMVGDMRLHEWVEVVEKGALVPSAQPSQQPSVSTTSAPQP